jgi:chromosome segregation ATPase
MSQIFDIVEELEKERKKNKELEKQLNCKKEFTKYLPKDTEFIILTKPDYDRQQEELQDKVFELEEKIDKALEYINELSNKPNIFGHYGIDGNCKKYLLNILKGDNNE